MLCTLYELFCINCTNHVNWLFVLNMLYYIFNMSILWLHYYIIYFYYDYYWYIMFFTFMDYWDGIETLNQFTVKYIILYSIIHIDMPHAKSHSIASLYAILRDGGRSLFYYGCDRPHLFLVLGPIVIKVHQFFVKNILIQILLRTIVKRNLADIIRHEK